MSELQAPPQHTTIDLSLNRTQPAPTTTTTTSVDNNTINNRETEHTDSDTLPAEEGIANADPKPGTTGSAKSTQSCRHSQVVDGSKPEEAKESDTQGGGELGEGEENKSAIEPEITVKDEGIVDSGGEGGANGDDTTNPPEEEIVEEEEEEVTESKEEEERPSHEAEEAEATKDTAVEEVSEELEQEEAPDAANAGAEAAEPQPTGDLEEGSSGEQGGVEPTTEPLDTSVPEEIVVRFQLHCHTLFKLLLL